MSEENNQKNNRTNTSSVTIKKQKPLIEGINTPLLNKDVIYVKSTFNSGSIPGDPESKFADLKPTGKKRLMPESVRIGKKTKSKSKKFLIVFCLIVVGGYFWQQQNLPENLRLIKPTKNLESQNVYVPVKTVPLAEYQNIKNQEMVEGTSSVISEVGTSTASSSLQNLASPNNLNQSSTTASSSTEIITSNKKIKINSTSIGFLNVRSIPSTDGKLLSQVHPQEIYAYTEVKYNWYKIILKDGNTGWVAGQFVSVVK